MNDEIQGASEALEHLGLVKGEGRGKRSHQADDIVGILQATRPSQTPVLVRRHTIARHRFEKRSPFSRFLVLWIFSNGLHTGHNQGSEEGLPATAEGNDEKFNGASHILTGSDGMLPPRRREPRQPVRENTPGSWLVTLTGDKLKKRKVAAIKSKEPQIEDEKAGTELIELERKHCLFDRAVPRGPPIDYKLLYSTKDASCLAQLNDTNPTATGLTQWLQHQGHGSLNEMTRFGPLDILLNIIYGDTLEITHHMYSALSDIGHDILDDTIIQQRLLHWRYLTDKLDVELRQLQRSLENFAAFLIPSQPTKSLLQKTKPAQSKAVIISTPLEAQLKMILKEIFSLRQRTPSSYNSLMANMNIVESKRGIAEAESVTKLTELAFLFIPLTFSASIFSMQVRELETADISIWAFFLLAACITFGSYSLRLFIRSEPIVDLKRRLLEEARTAAELAPGAPTPTRYFLVWIWNRMEFPVIFMSLCIAILVGPILTLWVRGTDVGLTTIMTIVIVISELIVAYFVGSIIFYRNNRGVHFHPDLYQQTQRQFWSRDRGPPTYAKVLYTKTIKWLGYGITWIFVLGAILVAICLITIWTRPLVKEIQVALTIMLIIIYFVCLLSSLGGFLLENRVYLNHRDIPDE